MAAVSKTYGIGDTVYVRYLFPHPEYWLPRSRVVKSVEVTSGSNEAKVNFEGGDSVIDGAVVTIYSTQALCAAAIVTDVISKSAAACVLDATTSVESVSGEVSSTLGRVD